ncbi:hypothetical protein [Litchfieldia alkalitelluris]|uniref:hypothetical protein n=1 Tax=Litchfieldia alkalitelluris TaxID=304268 RepID=UPI00099771C0|nr:hypothetical protein [Litchfieldia alkalitelluris]
MNIYVLFVILTLLLFLAGYAFYVAFKQYEEDDDFTVGINTFTFIEVVFSILLFISEKFFPKRYHIVIFKFLSFLFGLFLVCLIVLFWVLYHGS